MCRPDGGPDGSGWAAPAVIAVIGPQASGRGGGLGPSVLPGLGKRLEEREDAGSAVGVLDGLGSTERDRLSSQPGLQTRYREDGAPAWLARIHRIQTSDWRLTGPPTSGGGLPRPLEVQRHRRPTRSWKASSSISESSSWMSSRTRSRVCPGQSPGSRILSSRCSEANFFFELSPMAFTPWRVLPPATGWRTAARTGTAR